jgi:hypothetical protein
LHNHKRELELAEQQWEANLHQVVKPAWEFSAGVVTIVVVPSAAINEQFCKIQLQITYPDMQKYIENGEEKDINPLLAMPKVEVIKESAHNVTEAQVVEIAKLIAETFDDIHETGAYYTVVFEVEVRVRNAIGLINENTPGFVKLR